MHERYNPKSYDPTDLDESVDLEIRHASKHHEKSLYKSAPISKHSRHSVSERSLQMLAVNDTAGDASIHGHQFETRIKHGPGVFRRPDSLSNHHLTGYEKNFDGKQTENYTRGGPPKVNYRDRVKPLTSDFTYNHGEFLQHKDRGRSRKAPKVFTIDSFSTPFCTGGKIEGLGGSSNANFFYMWVGNKMGWDRTIQLLYTLLFFFLIM